MKSSKENPTEKTHSGVYGICKSDNSLLMILKSRGPYKGQYDLPGGRIENSETLENALKREFKEEIGCPIRNLTFFMCAEDEFYYKNSYGNNVLFHHTGSYYIVAVDDNCAIKKSPDGHDSLGASWVNIQDVLDNTISAPNIVKMVLSNLTSNT